MYAIIFQKMPITNFFSDSRANFTHR